jgi:hypothetical protein
MTTRFASAAELMARVLSMLGYPFAVIDHPISSASDAQLAEYARATVEQARGCCCGARTEEAARRRYPPRGRVPWRWACSQGLRCFRVGEV